MISNDDDDFVRGIFDKFGIGGLEDCMADLNKKNDVTLRKFFPVGDTLLHCAVRAKDFNAAEFLIMRGADINARGFGQSTPLRFASIHDGEDQRSASLVELLIRHRADIDTQDEFGATALHCAARKNDLLAVQALLEHNADCSITNEAGKTAAEVATDDPKIQALINEKMQAQTSKKSDKIKCS